MAKARNGLKNGTKKVSNHCCDTRLAAETKWHGGALWRSLLPMYGVNSVWVSHTVITACVTTLTTHD